MVVPDLSCEYAFLTVPIYHKTLFKGQGVINDSVGFLEVPTHSPRLILYKCDGITTVLICVHILG